PARRARAHRLHRAADRRVAPAGGDAGRAPRRPPLPVVRAGPGAALPERARRHLGQGRPHARRRGVVWLALAQLRAGPAQQTARAHNTVVALDSAGALLGAYRKVHLYDAFGHRESDRVVPGVAEPLRFRLDGVELGVQTCYDVRFPEPTRYLAASGAEVVLLPAAWLHGP